MRLVNLIQFPPEMDENWVKYGLAKLGQISKLPNWQMMLFCAYTTQLLHSTDEVCVRELDLAMCVSPSSNGSKMRSLWTNQMKS